MRHPPNSASKYALGPEAYRFRPLGVCGPYRARTDDLLGVNQTL